MHRRTGRFSPPIAVAASAALCGVPGLAAGSDLSSVAVSTGVALSASFGRSIEIGVSMDLRLTVLLQGDPYSTCSTEKRSGIGPYGQAGWYSKTGWRFGAGTHGGTEVHNNTYSVGGEFGWSYLLRAVELSRLPINHRRLDAELPGLRVGPPRQTVGSHALHLGFLAQIAPPDAVAIGMQLPLGFDLPVSAIHRGPLFTAGVGVRLPPLYGLPVEGCEYGGRPLRENGVLIRPAVLLGEPCARHPLDEDSAALLSDAWLTDARTECASVPVFIALARDLFAVGAPIELVLRALAAADEELHHTLLCAELASRFAGVSMLPLLPPVPAAAPMNLPDALCRLAVEAWLDGCIQEGAAAAQAARTLRFTDDADAAHALAVISADEAGHAELAWDVLDFCLQAGGRRVADALAPLVRGALVAPPAAAEKRAAPSKLLRAHGRLLPGQAVPLWIETARTARARGQALL